MVDLPHPSPRAKRPRKLPVIGAPGRQKITLKMIKKAVRRINKRFHIAGKTLKPVPRGNKAECAPDQVDNDNVPCLGPEGGWGGGETSPPPSEHKDAPVQEHTHNHIVVGVLEKGKEREDKPDREDDILTNPICCNNLPSVDNDRLKVLTNDRLIKGLTADREGHHHAPHTPDQPDDSVKAKMGEGVSNY